MEEEMEEEVWDETKQEWIKVPQLPKRRWKLIVETHQATTELSPLTLSKATSLNRCLLKFRANVANTKVKQVL